MNTTYRGGDVLRRQSASEQNGAGIRQQMFRELLVIETLTCSADSGSIDQQALDGFTALPTTQVVRAEVNAPDDPLPCLGKTLTQRLILVPVELDPVKRA